MADGYTAVQERARGLGIIVIDGDSRFTARCPAHDDNRASLSVSRGDDGRALIHCFAGCVLPAIVNALGMSVKALFGERDDYDTAQYVYVDEEGNPLIRVTRTWPKGFRQERWDADAKMWKYRLLNTRRVLYHLDEVKDFKQVWIVEGEKDADNLRAEGVCATTLLGGAGNWRDEYAESLRAKEVNIIADRDKPGQEGALKVKNGLRGIAATVDVWVPPEGYKDISDMLAAGLGLGDLERLQQDDSQFNPMDWEEWEPEETDWLLEPYIPKQSRVLAFGAAGTMKSLWAMWVCSQLAKEGHRVAYFSLEMPPREVAKRLRKLDPPTEKFRLFRKLSFESAQDLSAACDLLRGYSIIVVDSWSAVHGDTNNNDAVAKLDREFFLPLIEETGATLLILDNTGQAVLGDKGQKFTPDWARGASAKGDKMDQTLHFESPDEEDNHKTRIRVKKIRGDGTRPKPIVVKTHPDNIDFRIIDSHGVDLGSMWRSEGDPLPEPPPDPKPDTPASLLERLKIAREEARLREEAL